MRIVVVGWIPYEMPYSYIDDITSIDALKHTTLVVSYKVIRKFYTSNKSETKIKISINITIIRIR